MKSLSSTWTQHAISRAAFTALAATVLNIATAALPATDDDYVAHEWGTFTSIQGGDGILRNWNGIATADLPPFVYNWSHPGLERFSSVYAFGKGSMSALQRMETPVIYFYAKRPLRLHVAVQFPQGTITEWFPQAEEVGPSQQKAGAILTALNHAATAAGVNSNPSLATRFGAQPVTNSIIHWQDFEVFPAQSHPDLNAQLPTDAKSSHYFAARTKEAAFVRMASLEPTNQTPEVEKFLFYRGLGNFSTPLTVTMDDENQITLTNIGTAPLKHLFALAIKEDRATILPLGQLNAGQALRTQLDTTTESQPAAVVVQELSRQMTAALQAEGLYRSEAEAMVATWRDAWFEDQGVRILYVLPRAWTDSILPITLTPPPRELTRVMVGRAEIITPGMTKLLCECVEGYRQPDALTRQIALNKFKAMKLGRFTYVAMSLAAARAQNPRTYEYGLDLIQAAGQPIRAKVEAAQPARRLPATGG